MQANRFRKKPVVVVAAQWDGTNEEAGEIVEWIKRLKGDAQLTSVPNLTHTISIYTLEGVMHAMPGDWIIRGVKGEFYPCKPDIFEQTYEPNGTTLITDMEVTGLSYGEAG